MTYYHLFVFGRVMSFTQTYYFSNLKKESLKQLIHKIDEDIKNNNKQIYVSGQGISNYNNRLIYSSRKKIDEVYFEKVKNCLYFNDVKKELEKDSNLKKITSEIILESSNKKFGKKVFIVHGSGNYKHEIARFIENSMGLEAIILDEQPNKSNTIIEKFEENSKEIGFAIILYTSCDEGRKKESGKELKPRARQNVIFEHGFFVAKLGRKRVVALKNSDEIEIPNDLSGILYIDYDENGGWKEKIKKEIEEVKIIK